MQVVRSIARFVVAVLVIAYMLLDELLFPLFRPLIGWLASLRLFQLLGALIGRLPPYVALVLLAVPFIIIEPAKVLALLIVAEGHVVEGIVLVLIAQVLSLLICERIFHSGYEPLMRIGWFKAVLGWLFGIRDWAVAWAKGTAIWRGAAEMVRGLRGWFRGLLAGLR